MGPGANWTACLDFGVHRRCAVSMGLLRPASPTRDPAAPSWRRGAWAPRPPSCRMHPPFALPQAWIVTSVPSSGSPWVLESFMRRHPIRAEGHRAIHSCAHSASQSVDPDAPAAPPPPRRGLLPPLPPPPPCRRWSCRRRCWNQSTTWRGAGRRHSQVGGRSSGGRKKHDTRRRTQQGHRPREAGPRARIAHPRRQKLAPKQAWAPTFWRGRRCSSHRLATASSLGHCSRGRGCGRRG